MSTNQRWIISTPRSSQNFTISFVDFRLSIRFLPPSIRGAATTRGTLPTQHHRHVRLRLEPKPFVEAVLVLREQEETRNRLEIGVIQRETNELLSDAPSLVRGTDDHVPDRRPVRSVGDDPGESDELAAFPRRDHGMGKIERAAHVVGGALQR